MHCPTCTNVVLVMSDRQGIEIDYCPQCRGVWLDRGELDKIIEKSAGLQRVVQAAAPAPAPMQHHTPSYERPPEYSSHYKKKRREGFLSDLFDFD